jgi:hypothetical protein
LRKSQSSSNYAHQYEVSHVQLRPLHRFQEAAK